MASLGRSKLRSVALLVVKAVVLLSPLSGLGFDDGPAAMIVSRQATDRDSCSLLLLAGESEEGVSPQGQALSAGRGFKPIFLGPFPIDYFHSFAMDLILRQGVVTPGQRISYDQVTQKVDPRQVLISAGFQTVPVLEIFRMPEFPRGGISLQR